MSLGDSYSADEGLGDYEPGSHVDQSQCRVSVLGHCLYHKDPLACSGSITRDIYDGPGDPNCSQGHASGSYGEGCQVDRVNPKTSLVTMTIGGNDVRFANDLKNGYMAERPGGAHEAGCTGQQSTIDGEINDMRPWLVADLQATRARAPHARIIILTYPRPFPENPTQTGACLTLGVSVASYHLCLSPGDQRFLNDEAAELDSTICSAVQSAGVRASASMPTTRSPGAR